MLQLHESTAPATETLEEQVRCDERAIAGGLVWNCAAQEPYPLGNLIDLSKGGLRFRVDPALCGPDRFPVAIPGVETLVKLGVTLRPGEKPNAVQARISRVTLASDGQVEVACRFELQDALEMSQVRRKFVDAMLERSRQQFTNLHADLQQVAPEDRLRKKSLGEILLKHKAIEEKDLVLFLSGNREGLRIGEGLVREGLVSNRQVAIALSEHVGIPFVDLSVVKVQPEARKAIPIQLAKRIRALPFALKSRALCVAASRPLSVEERIELESHARCKVEVHLADPEQLAAYFDSRTPAHKRRAHRRIDADILVLYRFYGSAQQLLFDRTFEGSAADLSANGILIGGQVPFSLVEAFRHAAVPRLTVAAQLSRTQSPEAPLLIRFEPVRIAPIAGLALCNTDTGLPDDPLCWIGARISELVPEDRLHLNKLIQRLLKAEQTLPEVEPIE